MEKELLISLLEGMFLNAKNQTYQVVDILQSLTRHKYHIYSRIDSSSYYIRELCLEIKFTMSPTQHVRKIEVFKHSSKDMENYTHENEEIHPIGYVA